MSVSPKITPATEDVQVVSEVRAMFGFSRREEVADDTARKGLLRATTRPLDTDFDRQFELRACKLRDWGAADSPCPNLITMGFDTIDLSTITPLQSLLQSIRSAGELTADDAHALRPCFCLIPGYPCSRLPVL